MFLVARFLHHVSIFLVPVSVELPLLLMMWSVQVLLRSPCLVSRGLRTHGRRRVWSGLSSTMNGRKVISCLLLLLSPFPLFLFLFFFCFFCGLFFACSLSRTIPLVLTTLYFAAGLSEVPTGAVCLSSSQVLAFGQAAVRLERSRDQRKEQTLTRRKSLFVSVVSVFLSLFGSCF